jgi:hypothetical protein
LLVLLILIPIAWLAVVTLFVAVCQASAKGESSADPGVHRAYRIRDGLVVWDRDAALALRHQQRAIPEPGTPARRPGVAKRASRRERIPLQGLR